VDIQYYFERPLCNAPMHIGVTLLNILVFLLATIISLLVLDVVDVDSCLFPILSPENYRFEMEIWAQEQRPSN
jgi:hypothetical protein